MEYTSFGWFTFRLSIQRYFPQFGMQNLFYIEEKISLTQDDHWIM